MVLEALAAVGLAGNALQFIDFTYDLITGAREIRHSSAGLTADNYDLQLIADDLSRLSDGFTVPDSEFVGPLSVSQVKISSLALSSKKVSDELLVTITQLKGDEKSALKWHSFRKALKSILKKDKINDLVEKLKGLREQLSFHVVSHVSDRQIDLLTVVDNLNTQCESINWYQKEKIQPLLEKLEKVSLEHRDLSKASLDEIWLLLNSSQDAAIQLRKEVDILKSLTFSLMKARYSLIPAAHVKTFGWIFKPSRLPKSDPRSQIRFHEWLEHGNGFFWISGKPGSGKSTLMKCIVDEVLTKHGLGEWANGARLAMPSFYFWISGPEMQKSERGLLQQLLFEILKAFPDWIPKLCPERWSQSEIDRQIEWSLPELRQAFGRLNSASADPASLEISKICFFIDGLDEYEGDHFELIQTIRSIANAPHMKICVSSRPWNHFKDAFGKNPDKRLYLQDLTGQDMITYAQENLQQEARGITSGLDSPSFHRLVEDIADKSQGVFLWVSLVVKSLRIGLSNGDSVFLLHKRLSEFPSDLEEFFKRLIESVDNVYRTYMAYTFQVALRAPRQLLLLVYHFLEEDEQHTPVWGGVYNKQPLDACSLENVVKHKLNGRYKGLLEPVKVPGQPQRVDFLHRTIRDYLSTVEMSNLFSSYAGHPSKAILHGCKAFAALARALPTTLTNSDLEDYMNMIHQVEYDETKKCHEIIHILEEMNEALPNGPYPRVILNAPNKPLPGLRSSALLGAAIGYGILSYAQHKLPSKPSIDINSECLLCYALSPLTGAYCPDMVALLLRCGANPNRNFAYLKQFLIGYHVIPSKYLADKTPTESKPLDIALREWREILSLLVQNGASVGRLFYGWCSYWVSVLAETNRPKSLDPNFKSEIQEILHLFIKGGANPNGNMASQSMPDSFNDRGVDTPWKVILTAAHDINLNAHVFYTLLEVFLRVGADPYTRLRMSRHVDTGAGRPKKIDADVGVFEIISGMEESDEFLLQRRAAFSALLKAKSSRVNTAHFSQTHARAGQDSKFRQESLYSLELSFGGVQEMPLNNCLHHQTPLNHTHRYEYGADRQSSYPQPMGWQPATVDAQQIGYSRPNNSALAMNIPAHQYQWIPPVNMMLQQDQRMSTGHSGPHGNRSMPQYTFPQLQQQPGNMIHSNPQRVSYQGQRMFSGYFQPQVNQIGPQHTFPQQSQWNDPTYPPPQRLPYRPFNSH